MKKYLAAVVLATALAAAMASTASASHSWGGYHWARTANPFTVTLGDNLTASDWKSYLGTASTDWSKSTVMNTTIVAGKSRNKRCSATSGQDEICNGSYGQNGWLGLASISISGGTHITQGTVKVNDTYFASSTYNNPNEKLHVMCQEVGHTFGLDHQSTDGSSQNTCMDYFSNTGANDGSTLSTHPNQHDYDELGIIYAHLDSTTTIGAAAGGLPDAVPSWAASSVAKEGVYIDHLSNGQDLVTWVTWIDGIHGTL